MKLFVLALTVFLPVLSAQEIRHWFEDGCGECPGQVKKQKLFRNQVYFTS